MLESSALAGVDAFPRIRLGHLPTPLDPAPRISARRLGVELWIKRDDCTGLAFGGNKVRQLEFYLGEEQARGERVPVHGICVRREASRQRPRVERRAAELAAMIGCAGVVRDHDIDVCDAVLAPGYGRLSDAVGEAMSMAARLEGLFLDPVYTGKSDGGPRRPGAIRPYRFGKPRALRAQRRHAGVLRIRPPARALAIAGARAPARRPVVLSENAPAPERGERKQQSRFQP